MAQYVNGDTHVRLLPVANTRALLAIDGPAGSDWTTVIEATDAYEGALGNTITLAAAVGGTWEACAGTLTLTGNPTNAKASLDLDTPSTNCDTIIEAAVAGAAGNLATIAFIADGTGAGTLDESAWPVVEFHYEDGVTTVTNFETAVTASTNLDVKTGGTGANVLADPGDTFAATALTGGTTETVTIGSTVYTFVTAATTTAFEVEIGGSASATIDNLIAAIMLAAGSGTVYGSATTVHPTVRAYIGAGDTMIVHSKSDVLAAAGTLLATTVSADDAGVTSLFPGSWGAATLADGADGTNVTFVVTGTDIACTFADGFSTQEDFEAALAADADVAALVRVKTASTGAQYPRVVTTDDFAATALTGGGSTTSAQPSDLTDESLGVAVPFLCDQGLLLIRSTAGSGTLTADLRLWGYSKSMGQWVAIGKPNAGVALAEVGTDLLSHSELLVGLRRFARLYCQIVSLGGTATEVEVVVDCVPCAAQSS